MRRTPHTKSKENIGEKDYTTRPVCGVKIAKEGD
jgi:hypothetical protein